MINIGTFVTILPAYSEGIECDEFGYCCGWVREICADGCMLIEVKGTGDEFYISNRRIRIAA